MKALAPAILVIEAVVVLLVIPAVARGQSHVALDIAIAAALAACLILTAARARTRAGEVVGSVLQVALILTGLLAWPMWVLGILFAGLWVAALRTVHTLGREQHGPAGG
jgi:hypothetical protein